MGYYENPPIIQPNRGGEIIGASIAQAGESIAQGLIARGERKRAEEKERKLTLQKLQDRKNETDLYYAEKQGKWSQEQKDINPEVNKQIRDIIQQKLHDASDARIFLLNETDTAKRQEYLQTISNAESLLDNANKAAQSLGGSVATYRMKVKGSNMGKPGGYVVNGKSDDDINNNTSFLDSLSGMTDGNKLYKNSNIQVTVDDTGGGFNIRTYGEHSDGTKFDRLLNTKAYMDSEESVGDGLLLPVESLDSFYTDARMQVADKNNNILEGYLINTHETVNLPSAGGDQYQIVNGRKLNVPIIQDRLKKKAEIKVAGILSADNSSSLRTLIDYTLEQGPGWYDKNFAGLKTDEKNSTLVNMMTKKSFDGLTAEMQKTPDGKGGFNYWNPDGSSIKIKEKPNTSSDGGGGTPGDKNGDGIPDVDQKPDFREEDYDKLISGRTPSRGESAAVNAYHELSDMATTLNNLSGKTNKFTTREDLYKTWKNQKKKDAKGKSTDKTIEEYYNDKGVNPKTEFQKKYPASSQMYEEVSAGKYKPLKGYDLTKAAGRVKLALQYTADGTAKKNLQHKLKDAKLMDWINTNPRKSNETEQAYAIRAQKSNQ